jgi:hypothetical protein
MQRTENLSEEECWRLLTSTSVGRVAMSVRALPVIVPVQFFVEDRRLAFCLGAVEVGAESARDAILAFSADGIDSDRLSGWSVHVVGRSTFDHDIAPDKLCGRQLVGQIVHLTPGAITGARFHLCPVLDHPRFLSPR